MTIDMETIKVGYQRNITDGNVQSVPLMDILKRVESSETLKDLTDAVHNATNKDERERAKRELPCVIISADTTCRKVSENDKRTGLILIDIDGKDNPDLLMSEMVDTVETMISSMPFIIGHKRSASWKGMKVLCGIDPSAETHLRSFMALEEIFETHGLVIDRACKDLKRVNFLCHDPDIKHTLIDRLEKWNGEAVEPAPPVKRKVYKMTSHTTGKRSDMSKDQEAELCLQHLDPDMDYHEWIQVGMALKAHGASCAVWEAWSRGGQTYKPGECERKWNSFQGSGVGFGTVVNMAKQSNGGVNPIYPSKSDKMTATASDFDIIDPAMDVDEPIDTGLPAVTDADALMGTFPTKPDCLIEGVIGVGDKLILSASSKAGKTWLMLHLAYAVQNGDEWLGHQCKQADVLYVNFELTEPWLAERFRLISRDKHFQDPPSVLNLRGFNVGWVELSFHIKQHIDQSNKQYGLIILDPIYKMLGDCDENSNGDVAMLLNALERMGHETQTATAFSHHHSKGNKSGVDAIERMSGAGVWGREPDAIIDLTSHEDDNCWVVDTTARNYPKPPKIVVECRFPNFVPVDDADPDNLRKPGGSKKRFTDEQVIEIASRSPMGIARARLVENMVEALNISAQAARNRIRQMTKNDKFFEDGRLLKVSGRKS